jgi:Zn-finger nucleic acid-binding protein
MRSCPDCATTLFSIALGDASLSKCTCGGAWFSFGQLERVLGREAPVELLGGETSRRCPDCTLTLTPVVLPGGIPVETCTACRGTWLDWADVVELRVPALERAVRPADPTQRFGVFEPVPEDEW